MYFKEQILSIPTTTTITYIRLIRMVKDSSISNGIYSTPVTIIRTFLTILYESKETNVK